MLSEDGLTSLLEETGRQPAQQRSQPGLQRDNLVRGQTLDKLLCEYFLHSAQSLGLDVMKVCH